jgi:multimeric flavodoxin WrbA
MWFRNELVNKICASFSSAGTAHGGAEATTLALNNTFYHWGCIIVPPGYTAEGHPCHLIVRLPCASRQSEAESG